MTQRQLNKLIKIKKILKEREDAREPQIIKDYIMNDIIPKKEKTLEIAQQLKDFHKNMIENNLFPSMPSDKCTNEDNENHCQKHAKEIEQEFLESDPDYQQFKQSNKYLS